MKINNNSKYIIYAILFIIFILARLNHVIISEEIDEITFKSLAISHCSWPLGIIKETALNDFFSPIYYLIIGILKNEILIKIFNSIIAFLNIVVFYLIGKKIYNKKTGLFLALFVSINHFFLYYTSLIAPYCLIFLVQTLVINSFLDYLKKPNKKNFKNLNLLNIALILCDTLGFIYVACELFVIYLLGKRKKIYQKVSIKLFNFAFFAFVAIFPLLIVQHSQNVRMIIPNTYSGIGLNLHGLYLMFSEYISPYLSFLAPQAQAKSTIGLIYSFSLNPDLNNVNSIKILISLFYSSILPLIVITIFAIKSCIKNYRLRLITQASILNIIIILFAMAMEKIELHPIYNIQFFITITILLGYGIFTIKDTLIKVVIIACLVLIQIVNPDLNSFNVTIKKNNPVLNPVKIFMQDFNVAENDVLIMPYQGYFAKLFFKDKYSVLNYDDRFLQTGEKNSLIKNLCSKKSKTINRKNIHYLMNEYLTQNKINPYLIKYFTDSSLESTLQGERIILVIDKLNSRPISHSAIIKCAKQNEYSPKLKKIDFKYSNLNQNQVKNFYDALKSKTLYNFIDILGGSFKLLGIAEYKKIDNEYYRINSSNSIFKAINSFDSDYVFIIYEKNQ